MSVQTVSTEIHGSEAIAGSAETPSSAAPAFANAARIQQSVTANFEKRVLVWIARRLPPWVDSDDLTILGFASMWLACGSYVIARWNHVGLLLATLALALNWFGDSLDGTLARVRERQRPRYGFYVDHMIDSVGALLLMGGLAASGYMDWRIAIGMLVAFLLLSIEVYRQRTRWDRSGSPSGSLVLPKFVFCSLLETSPYGCAPTRVSAERNFGSSISAGRLQFWA
jgi:phosphatidylglycerophosphate synthase